MAFTKTRTKVVFFRLSEREYLDIQETCKTIGCPTVSEYVRSAVMRMPEHYAPSAEETVLTLTKKMDEALTLLHAIVPTIQQLQDERVTKGDGVIDSTAQSSQGEG